MATLQEAIDLWHAAHPDFSLTGDPADDRIAVVATEPFLRRCSACGEWRGDPSLRTGGYCRPCKNAHARRRYRDLADAEGRTVRPYYRSGEDPPPIPAPRWRLGSNHPDSRAKAAS